MQCRCVNKSKCQEVGGTADNDGEALEGMPVRDRLPCELDAWRCQIITVSGAGSYLSAGSVAQELKQFLVASHLCINAHDIISMKPCDVQHKHAFNCGAILTWQHCWAESHLQCQLPALLPRLNDRFLRHFWWMGAALADPHAAAVHLP